MFRPASISSEDLLCCRHRYGGSQAGYEDYAKWGNSFFAPARRNVVTVLSATRLLSYEFPNISILFLIYIMNKPPHRFRSDAAARSTPDEGGVSGGEVTHAAGGAEQFDLRSGTPAAVHPFADHFRTSMVDMAQALDIQNDEPSGRKRLKPG